MNKTQKIAFGILISVVSIFTINLVAYATNQKNSIDLLVEQMQHKADDNKELREQLKIIETKIKRNTADWHALDTLRDNECERTQSTHESCSK